MQITVNGEKKTIEPGRTIAGLLEELGLADRPCAVEVNRELTPKSKHGRRELAEGDAVEIVSLVGGG